MVFEVRPVRVLRLTPIQGGLVVIASDAQCDDRASGGFLAVDLATGERLGAWCLFTEALLDEWGFSRAQLDQGANRIQLCECAMVPIAFVMLAARLKGRQVLWFLDNTSALYGLVKGCCRQPHVDRSIRIISPSLGLPV